MYNHREDVLKIVELDEVEGLYATYRFNEEDKIVVRYSIIDGLTIWLTKTSFCKCMMRTIMEKVLYSQRKYPTKRGY
jgi:hypothetical protein